MLGLIQSKAKQGDAEAIQTLATLRSMGLIDDEPKVVAERPLWELFAEVGMYFGESNRYRGRKQ